MIRLTRRAAMAAGTAIGATLATPGAGATRRYRRISVEEAFALPETTAALRRAAGGRPSMQSGPIAGPFMDDLFDLGDGRLAKMDSAGIDVQLLSLVAPGVQNAPADEALALAKLANDRVAAAVRAHPTRFAGLAAVAPQRPEETAEELRRAVGTLGLKGAIVNGHTAGVYLDAPQFRPIFRAAASLRVPVYIHPREPLPAMAVAAVPGFTVGWGYGVETGTEAIRLMASGIFDELPDLVIVLGHLGETLPMLLERLDNRYQWETALLGLKRLQRLPSDYFRHNFAVTTSGMNYLRPLRMTIDALGIDRVLFAADYPMEDQAEAVAAVERMPFSANEKAKLFEHNAMRVFGLT